MSTPFRILGISGSLRKASYNTAALRAAAAHAPQGIEISLADLSGILLYDGDAQVQGFPPAVQLLGQQIQQADAVLFGCPEYNYSVSGVLKNAIDWVSRLNPQPFAGKPAGIIGATMGMLGTARAQYHLRQIGVFLDLRFVNKPEVMIAKAQDRFDATGQLTDAATREQIIKLLVALRESAKH